MIITKNLTHRLFIATLIALVIPVSHQLLAMEPESEKVVASNKIGMNKDFQAYKLLSLIDNDHQCSLLPELIQIITINVSKLIDKDCYEEYSGKYFHHGCHLSNFIESKQDTMSHISIANIVKRCLRHSNKSLDRTVFDYIVRNQCSVELLRIIKLITKSDAWNLICSQDNHGLTILHESVYQAWSRFSKVNEILSTAPNSQAAWDLIMIPDNAGNTALDLIKDVQDIIAESHLIIELFESYRPKEQ